MTTPHPASHILVFAPVAYRAPKCGELFVSGSTYQIQVAVTDWRECDKRQIVEPIDIPAGAKCVLLIETTDASEATHYTGKNAADVNLIWPLDAHAACLPETTRPWYRAHPIPLPEPTAEELAEKRREEVLASVLDGLNLIRVSNITELHAQIKIAIAAGFDAHAALQQKAGV